MDSTSPTKPTFLSRLSLLLSGLCVLHCLAVPFVILAVPVFSSFFTHDVEWWLTVGIIPVAVIGFIPTWLRHKNKLRLVQFLLALSLIIIAQTVLHVPHEQIATQEFLFSASLLGKTGLSFLGATLLAWVTYQNNRHTHVCKNHNHQGHSH
jgi:hypothetical protein